MPGLGDTTLRDLNPITIATSAFLVIALALVLAVCMKAVLISDYLANGHVIRSQQASTMNICAMAVALSALIAWVLQTYAKSSAFIVRYFYALVMLTIAFGATGGLFLALKNFFVYGGDKTADEPLLFKGYYWESLSGFYAFAIFMISALNLALIALFLIAALYIALVGPQNNKERGLPLRTSL